MLQFVQFLIDYFSQLDDISPFLHRYRYSDSRQRIIFQSLLLRLNVPFGNIGHVSQTDIVFFVSPDQEITDIFNSIEIAVYSYAYSFFPTVIVTGIDRCILSAEGEDDLGRMNPQIGHFRFLNIDINTGRPFSIYVDTAHPVDIQHSTSYQLGIVHHFLIIEAIRCHCIKHPVYIAEIVHDHRRLGTGR